MGVRESSGGIAQGTRGLEKWRDKLFPLFLSAGSAFGSVFNFYSFVFLPSIIGTVELEHFVRANYLGGLYRFGIGSSIAPITIFVLSVGGRPALFRYAVVSAFAIVIVLAGGFWLIIPPWSYLCLFAAICMHIAGFFLSALVRDQRPIAASVVPVVQPILFALLISLGPLHILTGLDWSVAYLISAVIGLIVAIPVCGFGKILRALDFPAIQAVSWLSILTQIVFCVSFPIFFQLELIFCGKFSSANVGVYAMVQKLYSSISISLFGSIGVHLLSKHLRSGGARRPLVDLESLGFSGISAVAAPAVGSIILLFGHSQKTLNPHLVLGSGAVAFLFTACAFIGLRLTATRPFLGLQVFAVSLTLYMIGFIIVRPQTPGGFLSLAGVFFAAFLALAIFEDRFNLFQRQSRWIRGMVPWIGSRPEAEV